MQKEVDSTITDTISENAAEVYACPVGDVAPSGFSFDDVKKVAEQCCEPVDSPSPQTVSPAVNNPGATPGEINNFIALVKDVASKMQECSQTLSSSQIYMQKIKKIKEDLFTLSYFFNERNKALIQYDTILLQEEELASVFNDTKNTLAKIQQQANTIFGDALGSSIPSVNITTASDFTDVSATLTTAYNSLFSLSKTPGSSINPVTPAMQTKFLSSIQSYSDEFTKNISKMNSLAANIKALQSSKVLPSSSGKRGILGAFAKTPFDLSSLLSENSLYPSLDVNTTQYSNQSGRIKNGSYFLLVQEESPIFDEIQALYELGIGATSMENFLMKTSSLKNQTGSPLYPYAGGATSGNTGVRGVLYSQFYNKFNSIDRVDFLFTSAEHSRDDCRHHYK